MGKRIRLAALATALCLAIMALGAAAETTAAEPTAEAVLAEGEAAPEAETAGDSAAPEVERGLEVYYFDVERVDAILIRCEGATCFVDVGFKRDAKPVLTYLRALGVEKLDVYIGTHAHADHVAGAATIIHELRPDAVLIPHKRVWSAILADGDSAQKKTCEAIGYKILRHGDIFPLGGATVKCLGPINVRSVDPSATVENDNSLIFKVIYGQRSFLFTGDTSDGVLRAVNKEYPGGLRSDVFKNPHHNGTHDADIVEMVQPKVTVFCTSDERQPADAYVRLLKRAGSASYVTCSQRDGNVLVTTDGVDLNVCCGYPLSELSLTPIPGVLAPGQELQLKGTIKATKKKADPATWLIWKSSDTSVVQVAGGVVKAVGEGAATVTATSINGLSDSVEIRVADAGVVLNAVKLSMKVGDAKQLKAKVSGAEGVTLEWLSEDESVAVVTQSGEVLAAGPGQTRVIARLSNGVEAACAVEIAGTPVKSVELSQHSLKLAAGAQAQLTATVSPASATDRQLEWASSDESVATVDAYGNVTAVAAGEARIGVRAPSGAYDICKVRVE